MPSGKAKSPGNGKKQQSSLLNFFAAKKPSASKPQAKTPSTSSKSSSSGKAPTTTAAKTPKDKIRPQVPKTPSTQGSTDVEDDAPPTKPMASVEKATSNNKDNDAAKKRSASDKANAAKKRRVIVEDSDEEEMEWKEDKATSRADKDKGNDDKQQQTPHDAPQKVKASTKKNDDTTDAMDAEETENKQPAKKNDKEESTQKDSKENSNPNQHNTKAASKEALRTKQSAPKKNGLAAGWHFMGNASKAVEPKKKRKNPSAASTATDASGRNIVKEPYTAGDDLPILSNPQAMFDDMVHNQLCEDGRRVDLLKPLLERLHGKTLRIATMCSGTESPVLALDMIKKSIEDVCQKYNITVAGESGEETPNIQCEHIFSCEIEPFKQSYIERNFQPKRLFRDIRELGNDQACTAFGALIDVPNTPGCVDLLVAGTSCVDYSNLNNKKKSMEELGESGQTFQGMLNWIKKAQPAIIIIENVSGAPWDKKVELMESMGYAATWMRVDTKNYYVPQTRQRGYLFASLKDKKNSVNQARKTGWKKKMKKLERPASAALDAFLLDNDDPRVLRGRARLCQEASVGNGESRAARTDWSKCETRHQYTRANEELGEKRPLTGWSESGKTTMPGFAWNDWVSAQVNRVHDLLDINTLRMAQCGVDMTYKSMIWNLSQNVDRDTMGRFNLSQCLTPTGIPFLCSRGGPLIGEELLLLQGIPADDLLLTKESESDLSDLAGNAMTTCVVGACILSGLLQAHGALPEQRPSSGDEANGGSIVTSLIPRPLGPASEVAISQQFGDYGNMSVDLGQADFVDKDYLKTLLLDGWSSARKCVTEGPDECITELLECSNCGHTASFASANPPRNFERHTFVPMPKLDRVHPRTFRSKLLTSLPTVLRIRSLNLDSLEQPAGVKNKLWTEWKERVKVSVASHFRFAQLHRRNYWSAVFCSPSGNSRLELRLYKSSAEWLLFAEAPCKRGALRDFLSRPVARFIVSGSSNSMLTGRCELRLPVKVETDITVEATGDALESWRRRLGLKGEFETETQYSKLKVSVHGENEDLKAQVGGVYDYLPACGGACSSIHKKQQDESGESPVFFFLESGRGTVPKDDCYEFANSCHRTSYCEHREQLLVVDPSEEFRPVYANASPTTAERTKRLKAYVPGLWVAMGQATLHADATQASSSVPSTLVVPMTVDGWKACPELVSFDVPMNEGDDIFEKCQQAGTPLDLNLQKSKQYFQDLAFVTARLSIPLKNQNWLQLDRGSMERENGEDLVSPVCAPAKPQVRWKQIQKGKKVVYTPIEDWQESAAYEVALKSRPAPWNMRLSAHKGTSLRAQIGFNAVSLCQRALGLFPRNTSARQAILESNQSNSDCYYEWRIVPHTEATSTNFERLTFTSNKKDPEADTPANFRYKLRKEQRRSLHWMLQQENSTTPFMEEEVCENVLPSLEWRGEGRAARPVLVRGGVIADEVGYGKTCISLACIDANPGQPEVEDDPKSGFVKTGASLIVVPGHLMGQWPQEITKFLGKTKTVLTIKDMKSMNETSIKDIVDADIVVVSFTVLCNDTYYTRLARFCGKSPSSIPAGKNGGRHFDSVYSSCLESLPSRVLQVKESCSSAFKAIESDAAICRQEEEEEGTSFRLDGKKAVYKNGGEKQNAGARATLEAKEIDPWKLREAKTFLKLRCPPLEMFHFRRVVADEFSYLLEKSDRQRPLSMLQRGLSADFRWVLSGTPRHESFDDIKCLANLMGCHLGVDESLPGAKLKAAVRGNENTGAESMSQYLEVKSIQWHERRHRLAQSFLDRFVRQNIAEIDEIPSEEHSIVVHPTPLERAIYLELETYLENLDFNAQSAKMSRQKSRSDRENRMKKILDGAKTAEEALIKCATHFDLAGDSTTILSTLLDIVECRKKEKADLEDTIASSVAAAIRQQNRIERQQPGWIKLKKQEKGELLNPLARYLDQVRAGKSIPHGADDSIEERVQELVRVAEKDAQENPDKMDPFFAGVNGEADSEKSDAKAGTGTEGSSKKKRKLAPGAKEKAKEEEKESTEERLFKMKKALRDQITYIQGLGKELCGRVRSLRYIEQIQRLQHDSASIRCEGCHKDVDVKEAALFSVCGHMGCLTCVKEHAADGSCVYAPSCAARVSTAHVVPSTYLGSTKQESDNGRDGSKLTAIVKKVQEIVASGDRMILFVQFDDLKEKVAQCLESHGIKTVQVKGRVEKQVQALQTFQEETPKKSDPRVLLLTMDNEQSAGLNLTNLNHVIFVHPLLADTQQNYDAYEVQAIGRVRRFGQRKTVYVWRFVVANSIDERIYAERGGRLLSATTNV